MNTPLTLGSLFDGIGGFPYAGTFFGIQPIWASEIEEAPIRITKRHFPNMLHLGNILHIHGGEIPPVDIITGGSPCQNLSSAGLQAGINLQCPKCKHLESPYSGTTICPECGTPLSLTDSGLFLHQVRIIKEMRKATNGKYPKILVWENVLAARNSNNGDDFYCVLKELCGLMGDELTSTRPEKWSAAGEIMADTYSVAWRTLDAQYWGVPQRRRRIFLVADFAGHRARNILFKQESLRRHHPQSFYPWQKTPTKTSRCIDSTDKPLAVATQQVNAEICEDLSPTITAANGTSGSNRIYVVINPKQTHIYRIGSFASNSMKSDNPHSGIYETDICPTLDCNGGNPVCNQGGNVIVNDVDNSYEKSTDSIVRRLTPLECERLQGFPDGWTEGETDSARYKALGNSVAIPCVAYIMNGIVDELDTE